jgi:hypothetical protein
MRQLVRSGRPDPQNFAEPKPGYIVEWDDLPSWQQEADSDIFEQIEHDA